MTAAWNSICLSDLEIVTLIYTNHVIVVASKAMSCVWSRRVSWDGPHLHKHHNRSVGILEVSLQGNPCNVVLSGCWFLKSDGQDTALAPAIIFKSILQWLCLKTAGQKGCWVMWWSSGKYLVLALPPPEVCKMWAMMIRQLKLSLPMYLPNTSHIMCDMDSSINLSLTNLFRLPPTDVRQPAFVHASELV